MQTLWAAQALTAEGWTKDVRIDIGEDGRIAAVAANHPPVGTRLDVVLPAPGNLHSHAFQRAMAGMTETRGPGAQDSFWTWRTLMYDFLEVLTPGDVRTIAAFAQMEMVKAGFASVGEFHYLHHQPDGRAYDDVAAMSRAIIEASVESGIGLTHLPVYYAQGGCDGRALQGGQRRFGNDPLRFSALLDAAASAGRAASDDFRIGVAPHSLRAIPREQLAEITALSPDGPVHIHIAEQMAEVEEIKAATGARPVEWLLANANVNHDWCLIHATQMTPPETAQLAQTGAVAGLCPITESNLGDGIFDGVGFYRLAGQFGLGTDSNIRISLTEEMRTLEYSQRLRDRSRAAIADSERSVGRLIFEKSAQGAALALARGQGVITKGAWADILEITTDHPDMDGLQGDRLLDTWIFARDDRLVRNLWSAGRHVVNTYHHPHEEEITNAYRSTLNRLRATL